MAPVRTVVKCALFLCSIIGSCHVMAQGYGRCQYGKAGFGKPAVSCSTPVAARKADSASTAWRIYPNPASQQLTLQWPGAFGRQSLQLHLHNSSGVLVWQRRIETSGRLAVVQLPLLPDGVYTLQLHTAQTHFTRSIEIKH